MITSQSKQPLVSVITVVLNDRDGILRTAATLDQQRFRDFEWVVVDGQSTDGTVEEIKRRANDIGWWCSEPDQGLYDAMNKGLRNAKGDYVVFMNAGDVFYDVSVLEDVARSVTDPPERPEFVFGGAIMDFPTGIQIYRPPRSMKTYIYHGLPASHQATFVLRKVHLGALFPNDYIVCGDYYVIANMVTKGGREVIIDRPLSVDDFSPDHLVQIRFPNRRTPGIDDINGVLVHIDTDYIVSFGSHNSSHARAKPPKPHTRNLFYPHTHSPYLNINLHINTQAVPDTSVNGER